MKVLRIIAPFLILIVAAVTGKTYKILAGKTGVGKTYMLILTGCAGEVCPGMESCTDKIKICPNDYIDTVGLDDNREFKVMFEGSEVPISGLTYPVYALFDTLEKEKISDVEFYIVHDANNIRSGKSSEFFMNFLTKDLQCSYTRVINKFRELLRSKLKNELLPGDLFVYEDATSLALNGKNCVFGLAPDWRQKVLASDLTAVRSKISVDTCNILLARKDQYEEAMAKKPQEINLSDCTENVEVGRYEYGGWEINTPVGSFGGGKKSRPIFEKRVNKECARRDDKHIAAIEANNQRLHEERAGLHRESATPFSMSKFMHSMQIPLSRFCMKHAESMQ